MLTFPQVAPGAPVTVSATQYVTYLRCPDRARHRSLGVYDEDSRPALRGMLAHRLFYRHLTGAAVTSKGVYQVCLEEIGERYNHKLPPLGLARMSTLRPLLAEVGALYERFAQVDMAGLSEAEIDLVHRPFPGVTLRGTVDAVFDDEAGVRLVDWKTGALGEVEHQLDFYSLLWVLVRGELPVSVEASSVSTGDRYVAQPTIDGLTQVARQVAHLVDEIRTSLGSGDPLPRVAGPYCASCPVLSECAEGAAAVELNR